MIDPTQVTTTTAQAAAATARQSILDRLRSLLGSAFGGSQVTTEYGAPAALTGKPHTGIDLAAAEGTPVQEPVGGTVERLWHDNVGGNQIAIKTPQGFTEIYAHLSAIPAGLANNPGPISPGQVIGYVGRTGMATGAHLHYEVLKPGGQVGVFSDTVDPVAFISEFTGIGGQRAGERTPGTTVPSEANNWLLGASKVQEIKDYINTLAGDVLIGHTTAEQAASDIKRKFPDVPASTLQSIAYGRSTSVASGLGDPLSNIADSVNRITGDLTNPQTWARLSLTFVGVALIIVGIVLYAGSALPRPKIA